MEITVQIPDDIIQKLGQDKNQLSRQVLEFIVVDAYRRGKISTAEVGQSLELPNRLATHAFLKRMGTYLNYDAVELEQDLQTLEKLRSQ